MPGVPIARIVDPALTRQMAEYVVLAVLNHHRRIDEYRAFQTQAAWRPLAPTEAPARRVGVMGLGVIGAADAFAALPQGAYVINVGRGAHLIEDDLVAAIDSGHLAGAWLDVFQSEPPPRR